MLNNKKQSYNVIMLGDITDYLGRQAVIKYLPEIIHKYNPILIIANAENSSDGGYGLDWDSYHVLSKAGIDVFTLGNHAISHSDIFSIMQQHQHVIAPANMILDSEHHHGYVVKSFSGFSIGIINLICNNSMKALSDNMFKKANKIVNMLKDRCNAIFVDVHGEDTEEKFMLANYLSGRVTAVCGTHQHIPVADSRILHDCTGYQTDLGMCGNYYWNHRNRFGKLIKKYMPVVADYRLHEKHEDSTLCGALINFNMHSGKCISIKSIVMSEHLNTML